MLLIGTLVERFVTQTPFGRFLPLSGLFPEMCNLLFSPEACNVHTHTPLASPARKISLSRTTQPTCFAAQPLLRQPCRRWRLPTIHPHWWRQRSPTPRLCTSPHFWSVKGGLVDLVTFWKRLQDRQFEVRLGGRTASATRLERSKQPRWRSDGWVCGWCGVRERERFCELKHRWP